MIPILHTEKLCKSFSNGAAQQHVIKNLDLEIMEGDFTVIMGASGSGKSTLLYALSGMDKPTLGKVFFGNTEIQDYSNDQLAVFRRKNCGFVFQSIYLLENQNVLDNVLTGAFAVQKNSPALIKRVKELLAKVGLDEKMQKKYPNQLSGGEAQRVKLATELAKKDTGKTLYVLDEPTTGLHFEDIRVLLGVLNKLVDKGNTIIVIEHNLNVIKCADYLIDMGPEGGRNGGQVLFTGTPEEMVKAKTKSYTAPFLKDELKNDKK